MGEILITAVRKLCKYFAVPFVKTAAMKDLCPDSFSFSLNYLAAREVVTGSWQQVLNLTLYLMSSKGVHGLLKMNQLIRKKQQLERKGSSFPDFTLAHSLQYCIAFLVLHSSHNCLDLPDPVHTLSFQSSSSELLFSPLCFKADPRV